MYRKCGILMVMNDIDHGAFRALFEEACLKCFGHVVDEPLTETESKLFYNKVFEDTGLVIGWKSIKNYYFFLFSRSTGGKRENPSVATLDTRSRYVRGASYTTEPERKKAAGHYPFWYGYRKQWVQGRSSHAAPEKTVHQIPVDRPAVEKTRRWWLMGIGLAGLVLGIICLSLFFRQGAGRRFRDDFHSLSSDSMAEKGWWVASKDTAYWSRRGQSPGSLTMFTLKGDDWPYLAHPRMIRNLLFRRIPCDCFTIELAPAGFYSASELAASGAAVGGGYGLWRPEPARVGCLQRF
jgi:hypothetical protein